MRVSGSALCKLTGCSWKTVIRRLTAAGLTATREGRTDYWESTTALAAVYEVERERASELDLGQERAALARVQRQKLELEAAARAGELVELAAVGEAWSSQIHACRARLLGLPSKLAPVLAHATHEAEIAERIRREVHDALRELAGEQGGRTPQH